MNTAFYNTRLSFFFLIIGYVVVKCHKFSTKAFCLRLVFHGVEAMLTYDTGPGIMRSQSRQLFAISTELWKKTEVFKYLKPIETYKFLFTIQMPLVQFPPSMSHDFYRCVYKLSAYLDIPLGYTDTPIMAQIDIKYIPLTETRLLKAPIYLQDLKKKKKDNAISAVVASVRLHSIEYVSGGTIQATVYLKGELSGSAAQSSDELSIVLSLYQVSKFNADAEPILEYLVETQTHVIRNYSNNSNVEKQYELSVPIDESLPPSFKYGMVMCLSYKLKIKIYLQKSKPLDSKISRSTASETRYRNNVTVTSTNHLNENTNKNKINLRKYLGFSWFTAIASFETPIVIATLGRGIRAGDELKEYSNFKNRSNQMPRPCFIRSLEYEDALPKYEDIRLPSYSDTDSGRICSNTINNIIIETSSSSIISTQRTM